MPKTSKAPLTEKRIREFIRVRNASQFASNLQFQIDADACGVDLDLLGAAAPVAHGYAWTLPFGTLREDTRFACGKMALFKDRAFAFGDSRVGTGDDDGPPELKKLLTF